MKHSFKKKWTFLTGIFISLFIVIQFVRPEIENKSITADAVASNPVKIVLRRSCYDCHSNELRLSWFDKVAPASWLVANDIKEARKAVNFSEWNTIPKDRQKGILFEALNQMQFKTMPLRDYIFMHPGTAIGQSEIDLFKTYLTTLMVTTGPDTAKTRSWNEQYGKWLSGENDIKQVENSLNGLAFDRQYKDWTVINSTERSDNGTLKIIMGNPIAVNAIKSRHVNPWPDGTAFAKLTWIQVLDSNGNISTGEFKQVGFMVKDAARYRNTVGWGFSQWDKGLDLAKHGRNAQFVTECVNCHKPMQTCDHVFTVPLNFTRLPFLEDKLICSYFNSQQHTMSTLYGNEVAAKYARTVQGRTYPPGAVLTLVTWRQKEDQDWFGANIPDTLAVLEKLRFGDQGPINNNPTYEKFIGSQLVKVRNSDLSEVKARIKFIAGQRASVMP